MESLRFLLRDRDGKYGDAFDAGVCCMSRCHLSWLAVMARLAEAARQASTLCLVVLVVLTTIVKYQQVF
jgi:hypothetical protein